jgi:signal transduction histidine kinase
LEAATEQIDDAGERMTSQSLARLERAADRERIVLISLLGGAALIGIAFAIGAGRFVERLRLANAQEQEATRQLAAALQTQSDFIADASHELRTPLTLIRGNAEIELAAETDSESRQALGEILAESTRMSRLVEDLLFLARSDAGVPPIDPEYVPVRWLLSHLSGPVEAMARHRDICTTIELAGDGHVEVDAGRIEQAVLILVDNASKFSPAGECVEIRSRTDSGFLEIVVSDAGPGIPAGDLPLIFERFYQVGTRRTRKEGGSGLGLPIAKSIVDAHDGTIRMESGSGRGTTVTIQLPLSRGE